MSHARNRLIVLVAGAAFCRCLLSSSIEAAERNGWLSARDCGASGSSVETTASTQAGSPQIRVASPASFQVGQGVMVSRCNIRYLTPLLWGPGEPYLGTSKDPGLEIRGYDGRTSGWIVYLLEIDGPGPTFRWTDDLARTWKASKVPVTHDWQRLSDGTEVRFSRRPWQPGHMISFTARDQLVSRITKIDGPVLTLEHPANRDSSDALVRHCDSAALQALLDRAVKEKKNVFLPNGHYRLAHGLILRSPAGTIVEGQSGVDTLLDISPGQGPCLALQQGEEATVRNLRMLGHTGLAEQPGAFRTSSGFSFWACTLKSCQAVSITGTGRVLVENVHASRMAAECFFSAGPYRKGVDEPRQYTRSATFLRCSVTDCAANAFNNCDFAENTSILHCRINGAGWHTYEGSGRFIRFIGNYVRNGGPVTIGDIPHTLPRLDHYHDLGIGQAVVADNVFEGIGRCGGVTVVYGTTQVAVRGNLFVNYNGTAIRALSNTVHNNWPSQNVTITGNVIDLTCVDDKPAYRTGLVLHASDTIASDNQVYVRGVCDPKVSAIELGEGALNLNVHDNLIRNCGRGIGTARLGGQVTEVLDSGAFRQKGLPLQWRTSHRYRGWNLVWLEKGKPATAAVIDAYDPDSLSFKLRNTHPIKVGDWFEVYPPVANWTVHHNTITGCLQPLLFDCYGSPATHFSDNLVARGEACGAPRALSLSGRLDLWSNRVFGFDEPAACALFLSPDRLGRPCANLFRANHFENCSQVLSEGEPGLWKACRLEGNLAIGCGQTPAEMRPLPK